MRFYTVPDARAARTSRQLRHRLHRLLLPAHVRPRLRRDGPRRPRRDPGDRQGRQHGGAAPRGGARGDAASSASSPRWPSRPSSRWSPASRSPGAAALSHDLWVNVVRRGEAPRAGAARRGPRRDVLLGVVAVGGSASSSRARTWPTWWASPSRSRRAPTSRRCVLSIFWRPFTTRGAQASMIVGDALGPRADLPLAHDPGGRPGPAVGAVPPQEPRARDDPARVRRRDRRLAPDARAAKPPSEFAGGPAPRPPRAGGRSRRAPDLAPPGSRPARDPSRACGPRRARSRGYRASGEGCGAARRRSGFQRLATAGLRSSDGRASQNGTATRSRTERTSTSTKPASSSRPR